MTIEAAGTQQQVDALRGSGLLQSRAEWDARNSELASTINELLRASMVCETARALDVGCMRGELTGNPYFPIESHTEPRNLRRPGQVGDRDAEEVRLIEVPPGRGQPGSEVVWH